MLPALPRLHPRQGCRQPAEAATACPAPQSWPGPVEPAGEEACLWVARPAGQAVWTAPVILEALIPGRMRSHVSTAEVPRGAARARGQDGVGDPQAGREGPGRARSGGPAAGCSPGGAADV